MSCSFRESYRVGSSAGDLAIKVFCAWDFKVIQRRSVKLQCENICTQLKVRSWAGVCSCTLQWAGEGVHRSQSRPQGSAPLLLPAAQGSPATANTP